MSDDISRTTKDIVVIERKMLDVTEAYERMRCEMLLMRVELGLSPAHSLRTCVQVLHEQGREAFEKLRGEKCDHAHQWSPL